MHSARFGTLCTCIIMWKEFVNKIKSKYTRVIFNCVRYIGSSNTLLASAISPISLFARGEFRASGLKSGKINGHRFGIRLKYTHKCRTALFHAAQRMRRAACLTRKTNSGVRGRTRRKQGAQIVANDTTRRGATQHGTRTPARRRRVDTIAFYYSLSLSGRPASDERYRGRERKRSMRSSRISLFRNKVKKKRGANESSYWQAQ